MRGTQRNNSNVPFDVCSPRADIRRESVHLEGKQRPNHQLGPDKKIALKNPTTVDANAL